MRPTMAPQRRPERWWIGGAVLLCHLVTLWAWRPGTPAPRGAPAASPTPLTVQLLPLAPAPAPVRDVAPPPPTARRTATTQRAATAAPTAAPVTATAPAAITVVEAPIP